MTPIDLGWLDPTGTQKSHVAVFDKVNAVDRAGVGREGWVNCELSRCDFPVDMPD
jgi:hypothetical protein